MRIRRVELPEAAPCEVCGVSRKVVVELVYAPMSAPADRYCYCIPCARRIGVAAMGGRWGSR